MIYYLHFGKKKDIMFISFLFIIYFKIEFSKVLDNFILKENLDTNDLIYVKDYHNLSLAITRSKKIYTGFPPTLKGSFSGSITKYSNAITCNKNFLLITCLSDHIIKKINLKTREVSNPTGINYSTQMQKSCSIAIKGNSVFIIVSSKQSDIITSTTFQYDFQGMNDETNGPYSSTIVFGNEQYSFSIYSIDVDQQIDIETISVFGNINDIHLVYFYIIPKTDNGVTIYQLIAEIEQKRFLILSSNIITYIRAYKLNYYTIRCIIKNQEIDLQIKKDGAEFNIIYIPNSNKIYEEELISHSNSLIFIASGTYIKIIKSNYQNYYIFSLKTSIKKILGIYNETTDYVVFYYQTENSLNCISFKNSSFYFQVKSQSSKYIKSYSNNKVVNINKLIIPNDDYGNIKISNILYEGGNITKDYYTYSELSHDLTISGNPTTPIKAIFLFNTLYEKQSNIDINLYLSPPLNVTLEFEGCSYFCNLCFYHYTGCSLQSCKQNYAFIRNTDNCYPINQLFKKYVYNSATKYFEKCYKTCDFCSTSENSQQKHNCLSCAQGYLRSYEYIGNCYKNNENNSDKIIINKNDESFTIVQSCIDTEKKLKINSTGECVSQCPKLNYYKNYTYNYINFNSFEYKTNVPQYQENEEILPKYNFGDLCIESCPIGYEADEINNLCICISDSCKKRNLCRTYEKRFYLQDKDEFTENVCSNEYFSFYFDCFIGECPSNTSISKNETKKCESNLNYCYIDNCFNSHCFLEPIKDYIYKFDNTKQYLKSCHESLNYTINSTKTYLYQNICYSSCPNNTEADENNLICNCKYYRYSENNDHIYNYICFSEIEKCREYIPVVDLKICLNTINDCIIKNYKIFNNECYSKICPENTELINDTSYCSCSYYFYNNSNYLKCLPEYASCQTYLYYFNNPYTKECFISMEDCAFKGNIYIFNDNCYQNECPFGTAIKNENTNLSYYICEIPYFPKIPETDISYILPEIDLTSILPEFGILYIMPESGITKSYCPPIEILENICKINYIFDGYLEEITENIETIIFDDTLLGDEEIVIFGNNIVYQITTSNSEIEYNNVSHIDFGECEEKLNDYYNISYFLILKFDVSINDTTPSKVEYNLYDPETKNKLNLSICDNKINIKTPLKIDENSLLLLQTFNEKGINIFNKYEPFFYDICLKFRSEFGTDMILSDRRESYFKDEQLFCEKGCQFINYDVKSQLVTCECSIKEKPIQNISIIDFDFKRNDLSYFFNIKTYANLACIKCYKLFLSKIGFINNYGNYMLLSELFIYIIFLVFFYRKYELNISKLISSSLEKIKKIKNPKIKIIRNHKDKKKIFIKIQKKKKKPMIKSVKRNNKANISLIKKQNSKIKKNQSINKKNQKQKRIKILRREKNSTLKILNNSPNNNSLINSKLNILKTNNDLRKDNFYSNVLNDEEMNSLEYENACSIDKRTFFQYYISLVKRKQIIIFTFMPINDFNLLYMKICLFIFSFSLSITVNGLFFTDESMHKIYKDKGIFNILYQLPKIIYSTIISSAINLIIKKLGLSESDIIKLRKKKSINDEIKINIIKTFKCLKIKFNFFFILGFLFLLIYWYYVGVFCAVYENTQIPLIKDTLTSFAINLIYPFALALLPVIFRIPSLRNKNKCLYKLSQIISII